MRQLGLIDDLDGAVGRRPDAAGLNAFDLHDAYMVALARFSIAMPAAALLPERTAAEKMFRASAPEWDSGCANRLPARADRDSRSRRRSRFRRSSARTEICRRRDPRPKMRPR